MQSAVVSVAQGNSSMMVVVLMEALVIFLSPNLRLRTVATSSWEVWKCSEMSLGSQGQILLIQKMTLSVHPVIQQSKCQIYVVSEFLCSFIMGVVSEFLRAFIMGVRVGSCRRLLFLSLLQYPELQGSRLTFLTKLSIPRVNSCIDKAAVGAVSTSKTKNVNCLTLPLLP